MVPRVLSLKMQKLMSAFDGSEHPIYPQQHRPLSHNLFVADCLFSSQLCTEVLNFLKDQTDV